MGIDTLKDLSMAGVQWEISENQISFDKKKYENPQKNTQNDNEKDKNNIIPATAPITLDIVKSMVSRPTDIESLIRMIGEFNHPLRNGVTNVVLPNIAKKPNGLIIITDLPSPEDDLSGQILSGNAGDMTDKMLNAIDMSRENVSIIPLIFWRTPGGRTPSREELDLSLPFVNKILEMIEPRIIITFGTLATSEIAQKNLSDCHGMEIINQNGIKIVPMYHPNYLILKPSAKKDVWLALQNVQNLLKNQ